MTDAATINVSLVISVSGKETRTTAVECSEREVRVLLEILGVDQDESYVQTEFPFNEGQS